MMMIVSLFSQLLYITSKNNFIIKQNVILTGAEMSFPPGQLRGALQEAGAYPPGREGGNKKQIDTFGHGRSP